MPPGVLAQLLEGTVQPGAEPVQLGAETGPVSGHGRARHPQLQGQRHQLLLGAVVQVALDSPPCLVGGGDHPGARFPQLPRQPPGLHRLVPQPGRQPAHHHRRDQEDPERGGALPVGRLERGVRRDEQIREGRRAQHRGHRGQRGAPRDGDGQHHQDIQNQQVQRGDVRLGQRDQAAHRGHQRRAGQQPAQPAAGTCSPQPCHPHAFSTNHDRRSLHGPNPRNGERRTPRTPRTGETAGRWVTAERGTLHATNPADRPD